MFRPSKSKSGFYLPVMIIYFVLIKLGELYDVYYFYIKKGREIRVM